MMEQGDLFNNSIPKDKNIISIGTQLYLKFNGETSKKVALYNKDALVKTVDLSDRIARKLLVVEAVELGAIKHLLAKALQISRQTIHNYVETKKYFGLEGLIASYVPSRSKNLHKQRKEHTSQRHIGNKARQLEQIRKNERETFATQFELPFGDQSQNIEHDDQPFSEEHDWKSTRYAGVFAYLITLINQNKWFEVITSYFGDKYKIFMVFILMVACNVRSIEQLKNIHKREAGLILGIKRLPSKFKAREWLYAVAQMNVSKELLFGFFRRQIHIGIVGIWLWFTDGHLLPYTGKKKVRSGYNTQRRMMVPGRTNLVTCDVSGRVVDFDIQEGKGDIREYIINLGKKWKDEVPEKPVMVFDREGYGAEFFFNMNNAQVGFVTWEKHIDTKKLKDIGEEQFSEEFEFNNKIYRIFEGTKEFSHTDENDKKQPFTLRRIYIWNITSNHRTCALSNETQERLSTKECALAILSRWGASENTFKHLSDRHPLHYQPGFKFTESEKQEITNPERKEKRGILTRIKQGLNKLYKKFSKSKEICNKDGNVRQNSLHQRLKQDIEKQEAEIDILSQEIKQLPEKIDITVLEDYNCFERICNESKNLFDFVTSSVWNVRKSMSEWLLSFYENKNEYVDLFYAISECHGWIKSEKNKVTVRIEPLQQPSRRAAQKQFCRKLTDLGVITPAGKWLVIEVGKSPLV